MLYMPPDGTPNYLVHLAPAPPTGNREACTVGFFNQARVNEIVWFKGHEYIVTDCWSYVPASRTEG